MSHKFGLVLWKMKYLKSPVTQCVSITVLSLSLYNLSSAAAITTLI